MDLAALSWPTARVGDALEALSVRAGGEGGLARDVTPASDALETAPRDRAAVARTVDAPARRLGVGAEPVTAWHDDEALALLRHGAPALVMLPNGNLLAIAASGRRRATLLASDGRAHRVRIEALRDALCDRGAPAVSLAEELLAAAGVPARDRVRARAILAGRSTSSGGIDHAWLVRLPAGAELGRGGARVGPRVAALAVAHAVQFALWIAAWALLGRAALGEGTDAGVLAAWALLLLCLPPLRVWVDLAAARLSVEGGAWLKRRLLAGALRLRPDDVRHQGAGQLFGRVSESEALETLGLGGGLQAGVASVELVLAGAVLALGAGGVLSVAALAAAVAATVWLTLRYRRLRAAWTRARLDMTNDLVEKMVGRRTLLAQVERARWHRGEDETLERHATRSRAMDAAGVTLISGVPRVQLLLGVVALMPAFVSGASATSLAIGLGGTLLAYDALARITVALAQLTGAAVAWKEAGPLYDAAARESNALVPAFAGMTPLVADATARIVVAEGLAYQHDGRAEPTLRDASLTVARGERVVLEGASGAGKSTLAAILAGLREPASGLLLVGGLDRHTLDADSWRRRVVLVPQFHENHVFSGTLAFNLLMGRGWPPEAGDVEEAEVVCRELALGPL